MFGLVQVLLARADKDYPKAAPPPLRFIRSCSSALAPATLHKLEAAFGVPVLEVRPALPCWVRLSYLVCAQGVSAHDWIVTDTDIDSLLSCTCKTVFNW